jgi:hypothetical protein
MTSTEPNFATPDQPSPSARLRVAATLWSLLHHPAFDHEWSLAEKVAAIAEAGFDGVQAPWRADLPAELARHNLKWIAAVDAGDPSQFAAQLKQFQRPEVPLINAQLGDHDTSLDETLAMAITLLTEAERQGLHVQIETHRDTATETPEKFAALARSYRECTGKPLPVTWDHSHYAVVKQLRPEEMTARLLAETQLNERSSLLHCRPFNGNHTQVPVSAPHGGLTREFMLWIDFMRQIFERWLASPDHPNELWIVPEIGAGPNGYHLSVFPPAWPEAQRCATELRQLWTACGGTV